MHRTAQILARGDPGFFDFIKKVGGAASRVGRAAFGATPLGAGIAAFRGTAPAGRSVPSRDMRFTIPAGTGRAGAEAIAFGIDRMGSRGSVSVDVSGPVQPAGHHLNKSSYFLRDGTFVPARSRWVRNRTRNNANGRALRRAIGRAKGFDNLVKRNRKALRSLSRI